MKHLVLCVLLSLVAAGSAVAQDGTFIKQTPVTQAIAESMAARFKQIRPLLDQGAVGFGRDGMLVVRQAPDGLAEARRVRELVAEDNRDREAVVSELARANDKPEWASQVQASLARQWVARARPGWYYQDASGGWVRK